MKSFTLILKSLFKNSACLEGGRHKPWYFALIIFILSVMIATIPSTVNAYNVTGSKFISGSYTYGYDIGLVKFSESINDNSISLTVKSTADGEGKYLYTDKDVWNTVYGDGSDETIPSFTHKNSEGDIDFQVYYVVGDISESFLNSVINSVPYEDEDSGEITMTARSSSFLILGGNSLISYLYKPGSTTQVGSCYGDYLAFEDGYNLQDTINVVIDGVTYTKESTGNDYNIYKNGVFSNWSDFYDVSYIPNRNTATWTTTVLILGINILLTFFMGLMIFILTRGKTNPFSIFTFWESSKVAFWTTSSPALLALILGFIIPAFAMIAFPLFIGVRVMFLSMKDLKPENAAPIKQPKVNTVTAKPVSNKKK